MDSIHQKLQSTIADIYRKAIDADRALDHLQRDQKGKFQAIFPQDAGFETSNKRFGPYVQEVTTQWEASKSLEGAEFEQTLTSLVKKIELLLTTLSQFKATL